MLMPSLDARCCYLYDICSRCHFSLLYTLPTFRRYATITLMFRYAAADADIAAFIIVAAYC